MPYAIIFFCIFGLGYPLTILIVLRWNKDLIKEDQLLRAKGLGNDRVSNPRSYEIRKRYAFPFFLFCTRLISILIRSGEENLPFSTFATSDATFLFRYHKLYYHFKPGKTYWILVIINRKFWIAVASLLFADNPSFQLATVLLVLFVSYVLQVQHRPFMSTAEREAVLKHHRAKIDSGSRAEAQKHLEIAERLKEIDDRIAHEQRLKLGGKGGGSFSELAKKYTNSQQARKYFWDFNTVEQTLLACAIVVCLAGIMFESPRFIERDDLEWQKSGITYLVIIVIAFSLIYYSAIFLSEAFTALGIGQSFISACTSVFMSKKYKERTQATDELDPENEKIGHSKQMSDNPMFYSADLKEAETKAEHESEKARELIEQLQKMKEVNEKLVNEVNDAKKKEAAVRRKGLLTYITFSTLLHLSLLAIGYNSKKSFTKKSGKLEPFCIFWFFGKYDSKEQNEEEEEIHG